MAAFSGYSCGCCSAPGREAGVGVESDVPLYECESQGEEALLVATFSGIAVGAAQHRDGRQGWGCSQTSLCSTSLPSASAYRDLG